MRPVILVLSRGILTGRSSQRWPEQLHAEISADPALSHVIVLTDTYFEWPLPRLAWLRNRRRARWLADRVRAVASALVARRSVPMWLRWPRVIMAGHSNGAYLNHQAARLLIREGVRIERLTYIAAAIPERSTRRELLEWAEDGMLGEAEAWSSQADRPLTLVRWLPSVVTWPWGSLGRRGFGPGVCEDGRVPISTYWDAEAGHGGWWAPGRREESFARLIAPLTDTTTTMNNVATPKSALAGAESVPPASTAQLDAWDRAGRGMGVARPALQRLCMAAAAVVLGLCMMSCMTMSETATSADGTVSERKMTIWGTDADALEVDLSGMRLAAIGLNQSEGVRHVGRTITGTATVAGMTASAMAETRAGVAKHAASEETTRRALREAGRTDRAAIGAAERSIPAVVDPEASTGGLPALGNLFRRR